MIPTPQQWLANILETVDMFADREAQERRWLAPDPHTWESPVELIASLEDAVFDDFITTFDATFSAVQRRAIRDFQRDVESFSATCPQFPDRALVLADPRWRSIQDQARALVLAFRGHWPAGAVTP